MHYPTDNELHDIYLSHNPTVQELEMYRVYCEYKSTLKNIDLKLEATKAVPTILEETMSVAQLFESGEACLPIKPQTPKAKTPRTIKGAVCGTTEGKRETLKRILLAERKREKVVCALIDDLEQYPDLQPVFAAYHFQPVHEPEKLYEATLD